MTIRVALNHRTSYDYDKLITVNPQMVRLRPAPHCRTPILSYSLKVEPSEHFCNWQQDPHGNFIGRFVFPKKTRRLSVTVDLVADMTVINPFDFFIEDSAEHFPFKYDPGLERELRPFLETEEFGPKFKKFVAGLDRKKTHIVNFLVELNRLCQQEVKYLIRLEPGVQTPEETLVKGSGSCRDSAWLLVQVVRQLGLAARFVSGYLIQLAPDQKSLDGPSGTEVDFTDLHAWTEIYVPGAGWIGLDPTSGLLAGEGHIPLAATPDPSSAAPITGSHEKCEVEFDFAMSVTRIHEDPRVTKPYTPMEWEAIEKLGHIVDERLTKNDVRLTIGGEPTFVSIDDMDGAEWNTAAVGPDKRRLSEILIKRLRERFCPGALLHYGQGKWYPGESLPRWALACFWRKDGVPAWENPDLIADVNKNYGHTVRDAHAFANRLADLLEIRKRWIVPAYEDVAQFLIKEQQLPVNVDPRDPKLNDPEERARMARVFQRGVGAPVGFVVPLRRQWWQAQPRWTSGPWPVRSEKLFLLPGDSPIGLRLPIDSLPWAAPADLQPRYEIDPLAPTEPLPRPNYRQESVGKKAEVKRTRVSEQYLQGRDEEIDDLEFEDDETKPSAIVRTALCIEPRGGTIHVFMPPMERLEDYLDLAHAVEVTAAELDLPVVIEGYLPPHDPRINVLKVTPDPGVIEVNTHPVDSWDELVQSTKALYEEARLARLGTEKFDLDGKHWGTGGGNHVVLGGRTPADSPFLRRPDLLKSMIAYWINHPSLSYLFSGRFVGPTSQAPRVDEGRRDSLYELDLAFSIVPKPGVPCPPWLVDRIFRNLLTDLTGNTHRAEFCIDKLYSPDSSTGRLGLLELRGFEMPPHAEMSLTQQLLIRALIARFWEQPYEHPVVDWGTTLHDRFLLPHFVWEDFKHVIGDLKLSGFAFESDWFATHFEFRFPKIGDLSRDELQMELRTAIEPWYVLGEEPAGGGTVRFVDSSVERLQLKLNGVTSGRYIVTCNNRKVPLVPTGVPGEMVAAVRYRAWQPASCLHPTIPVHSPLTFDILDTWSSRSIGGCMVHVAHPAGRNYQTFPVNPYEAEARRAARFFRMGHTPGQIKLPTNEHNPLFPLTLDLRRRPS
ncbi:MAG: transglutaminase family protein [Pirellulaceae bacterium]|nr:transglutaminase family protein [Pirellulaceae bacterium]